MIFSPKCSILFILLFDSFVKMSVQFSRPPFSSFLYLSLQHPFPQKMFTELQNLKLIAKTSCVLMIYSTKTSYVFLQYSTKPTMCFVATFNENEIIFFSGVFNTCGGFALEHIIYEIIFFSGVFNTCGGFALEHIIYEITLI